VDLNAIGTSSRAEGYSGADCAALLREAGLAVLKEDMSSSSVDQTESPSEVDVSALRIMQRHFDYAFLHVVPSVSRKDQARYNRMRDRMAHARSRGAVIAEIATEDGDDVTRSMDLEEKGGEANIDIAPTNPSPPEHVAAS
jgi:arginine/lysine/ornithine decarboxylase